MKHHTRRGFTLIDVILVIFIVGTFAILLLPQLNRQPRNYGRIMCASNLKQVSLAFRLWEGDNNDKYPQAYAGTNTYPAINNPTPDQLGTTGLSWPKSGNSCSNLFTVFLSMSNELSNPKIVVCPDDAERGSRWPTNFAPDILNNKNNKISYFIDAMSTMPIPT